MKGEILVVEDEETQANIIKSILEDEGYSVDVVFSGEEALKKLRKKNYGVLLVDLKMPGMGGMGLLKKAKEIGIGSNIIIMTAYGTIETAVEAMKNGAFDYITKPFGRDELLVNVEKALKSYNLYFQNIKLREELETISKERKLVGKSKAIQEIHQLIDRVAINDSANVLITGESGTGKELVAREIHEKSPRANMPFIAINCSAVPETLLESELFGYVRGAFTGAVTTREGKFKKANGGTVFLDEIADMPMNMQVKLLRVIQDKEVTPIGGDEPVSVNIRFISATNRNIQKMVQEGRFRDDLYYRLHVVPIHIPPLRDRKEDIPLLVEFIISKLNNRLNKNIEGIDAEVIDRMMNYDFPGNVRELENMIERAFIVCDENILKLKHFPIFQSDANRQFSLVVGEGGLKEAVKSAMKDIERNIIEKTLIQTKWNRVKAAKILKIDYKTLRQKIKELNLMPVFDKSGRKGDDSNG